MQSLFIYEGLSMHQKFFTSHAPILAEGDFMGVFLPSKKIEYEKLLISLIKEGEEREEKVLLDSLILKSLLLDISSSKFFAVPSFILGNKPLTFFLQEKENAFSEGYSGIRYIGASESLFQNDQHHLIQDYRKELLSSLMDGGVSVAVLYRDSKTITFSELCRHPRIYHHGIVRTNPLFILPERAGDYGSELDAFLDKTPSRLDNSFNEGETFPSGVPDMLESIIDSMGVGVVVGDTYGNMVLLNKSAQKMVGLPPSSLPYPERMRRFGNYLADGVTPYPYDNLPFSRATRGEDFENEVVCIKNDKNKEGSWIVGSGRGVRDSNGTLLGGVVVYRDATEEYKTQKEKEALELTLLQAQKMESLGMLAGGIAHDFNNLLVGVLGNASILLKQELVHEQGKPRLQQIEFSALQLTDLTKQLLMYAGLSPGKSMKQISVVDVVDSMKGIFDTGISKKVTLNWEINDQDVWIKADEVQIRQVLLNLVTNASDAHRGTSGSITVRVEKKDVPGDIFRKAIFASGDGGGQYAVLEVSDTGGGISDDVLDKIFDPFFSTKGMGRGLGLSAVLGIVKNHNGALEVKTEQGIGTAFRIYLPLAEPLHQQIEVETTKENSLRTGKILIIDDEPMVVDVAQAILEDAGFDVITANSGGKGLKEFSKNEKDIVCVIIDMTMPDMGGDEVYKKIRKLSLEIPIVLSSGFSKDLCKNCYEGDSFSRFLEKPYPAKVLLDYIQDSLTQEIETMEHSIAT